MPDELRTTHHTAEAIQGRNSPTVFQVTIITAGPSLNGLDYPDQVLEAAAPLFDRATAFLDHAGNEDYWRGTRSVRDVAGAYGNVRWNPDARAVEGDLHIIDAQAAALLAAYVEAKEQGKPTPDIGISADLTVTQKDSVVAEILRVHSADIVFGPAAGGIIQAALEALSAKGEQTMTDEITVQEEVQETTTTQPQETIEPQPDIIAQTAEQVRRTAEAARLSIAQDLLNHRLAHSDLPDAAQAEIRRTFEGRAFEADELDEALRNIKALVTDLQPSPVTNQGAGIQVTMNPLDRIQMAADRLLGAPDTPDDAPRLSGIRELYLTLTGDTGFTGIFNPDGIRVSEANITTSTFAGVCKNALNKALLAEYNTRYQWWKPIVHEEDFPSLQTVSWIKTATIADLATVSEGGAYTELDSDDTVETSAFVKKGGYIGLTLEAIDTDNVQAFRRIPRELATAAWRTLSALVSAIFTASSGVGPTMADSKALFHADHANLRTVALSFTEWQAVVEAMYKQTDPKNSKRLGLRPRFCLVPIELEKTALQIFGSQKEPDTADNQVNPYYGQTAVVTVPHWTDANNWAAVADPKECPGVCIGYRYGRAPELFVADSPLVGSMFTNDELRIKARFLLAVGVADYRPLAKNNVA